MFPQDNVGQGGGSLEDRLRGLILSNAIPDQVPAGGAGHHPATSRPQGHHLAPQMLAPPCSAHQETSTLSSRLQEATHTAQPSQRGGKRMNQAQRRQMNSQMSIPIDLRPIPGVQAGRGAGINSPSWGNTNFNGRSQPHQGQRLQQYQQYSPRFQHAGPGSPYSPQSPFTQGQLQPQSPVYQFSSSPNAQYQPRQPPNQFQPAHQNNYPRPPAQNRQLFQPGGQGRRPAFNNSEDLTAQITYLDSLVEGCISNAGVGLEEETEKEAFRAVVEQSCREAITEYEQDELGNPEFDPSTVELQCFGSMRTGFATKASDMDLALLTPTSDPAPDSAESLIPRILEKKLLSLGYGARLLTRTRVPIIKLCEKPTEKLRFDLLEERTKWENGFVEEVDDEVLEGDLGMKSDATRKEQRSDSLVSPATDGTKSLKVESSGDRLATWSQKQASLGDYYNNTKRFLRQLGGRDIAASSPTLSAQESRLLNDVCKAFISGLSSQSLSVRLRGYQSIMPLFDNATPFVQRSLHGVWTQIEGERLASAWESRPLTEINENLESMCRDHVLAWRNLQDDHISVIEALAFNRKLYLASEKLKTIHSLQLAFLEQIPHEAPVFYQSRAQNILNNLQGRQARQSSAPANEITSIVIAHYVSGIHNDQIRDAMGYFHCNGATLERVAVHHRALQLATDYEHALQVGIYEDADKADVEQYIEILRGCQYDSPISPELLAKMRSLPDPTHISPSKPRDRYKDHLEFPKTDIGIQCDINFSAHLAIHNTQLLRCYSVSDPRVKPMILFIKHWAKVRGINTPYRGTLSSYGYVLMVLHYLVNVAQPFVCPNLQAVNRDPPPHLPLAEQEARKVCKGRDVRFWRSEAEIRNLAEKKMLNHNHDSLGLLLRGFFEYYAQNGPMTTVHNRGFDWGRDVLSLRTMGGLVSKQEKGWVGAKTVVETSIVAAPPTPRASEHMEPSSYEPISGEAGVQPQTPKTPKTPKIQIKTIEETKEIRHRYLFAIEDPFELDHNVARTVTHNGIVSIRDEFRRAWRIIKGIGKSCDNRDGNLLDPQADKNDKGVLHELMDAIHGTSPNGASIPA